MQRAWEKELEEKVEQLEKLEKRIAIRLRKSEWELSGQKYPIYFRTTGKSDEYKNDRCIDRKHIYCMI